MFIKYFFTFKRSYFFRNNYLYYCCYKIQRKCMVQIPFDVHLIFKKHERAFTYKKLGRTRSNGMNRIELFK